MLTNYLGIVKFFFIISTVFLKISLLQTFAQGGIVKKTVVIRDTIQKRIIVKDTIRVKIYVSDTIRNKIIVSDTILSKNSNISDSTAINIADTTAINIADTIAINIVDSTAMNIADSIAMNNYDTTQVSGILTDSTKPAAKNKKFLIRLVYFQTVDFSAKSTNNNIGKNSISFSPAYSIKKTDFSIGISKTIYKSELFNKQSPNKLIYSYSSGYVEKITGKYYIRNIDGEIIETVYIKEKVWSERADSIALNPINTYEFIEFPFSLHQTFLTLNKLSFSYTFSIVMGKIYKVSAINFDSQNNMIVLEKNHFPKFNFIVGFGTAINYCIYKDMNIFISPEIRYFPTKIYDNENFTTHKFTPFLIRFGFSYYIF